MKISFVEIRNFRKLKQCRIDFSEETTLFVGPNNSGKTSAMDALVKFLANRKFSFTDFTLSHRAQINQIGNQWINPEFTPLPTLGEWESLIPALDIWLEVSNNELQYISHLIPYLDWTHGFIGVRFIYQPKDISFMYNEYITLYRSARTTEGTRTATADNDVDLSLWPNNLCSYLEKKLNSSFERKAYILDPAFMHVEGSQKTNFDMECFEQDPLNGLILVDVISAQRGFNDPDASYAEDSITGGTLSSQLRSYYDKHLDPEKAPTPEDLNTLAVMETARRVFNDTLGEKFRASINELEDLGYPGFNDPRITITTKLSAVEALKHDSSVQYSLNDDGEEEFNLPEKYNGLGYQNLVSMVFRLIRFRDDWIRVGKSAQDIDRERKRIEPIHLVLLEEPEAHLHVQVQQVFIKKAYKVLTNSPQLRSNNDFHTQLVISSHSSHIARELDFSDLRYFKKLCSHEECPIPTTKVINLSDIFGKDNETKRFVARYLQTTHCDLFFADAAILIEGAAERLFIPHFIKNKYPILNQRYITILEINGSHAHRLKPLIDKLCLNSLIITDIDPVEATGHHSSAMPERNEHQLTGNSTLKEWHPRRTKYDDLIDLPEDQKILPALITPRYTVRIAYQIPILVQFKDQKNVEALPSTFEDSLIYTNLSLFSQSEGAGFFEKIKKYYDKSDDFISFQRSIHEILHTKGIKKADFSLDLIFSFSPMELSIPSYITEGLTWLQDQFQS